MPTCLPETGSSGLPPIALIALLALCAGGALIWGLRARGGARGRATLGLVLALALGISLVSLGAPSRAFAAGDACVAGPSQAPPQGGGPVTTPSEGDDSEAPASPAASSSTAQSSSGPGASEEPSGSGSATPDPSDPAASSSPGSTPPSSSDAPGSTSPTSSSGTGEPTSASPEPSEEPSTSPAPTPDPTATPDPTKTPDPTPSTSRQCVVGAVPAITGPLTLDPSIDRDDTLQKLPYLLPPDQQAALERYLTVDNPWAWVTIEDATGNLRWNEVRTRTATSSDQGTATGYASDEAEFPLKNTFLYFGEREPDEGLLRVWQWQYAYAEEDNWERYLDGPKEGTSFAGTRREFLEQWPTKQLLERGYTEAQMGDPVAKIRHTYTGKLTLVLNTGCKDNEQVVRFENIPYGPGGGGGGQNP